MPLFQVSWMRLSDVTILSVGSMTFSSDIRISVVHIHRYLDLYKGIFNIFLLFIPSYSGQES